jgi:hypothetical protein
MAEQENPIMSPLVGQVFTAMFKQSEATTNLVLDNQDREIAKWKKNFYVLYRDIEQANEKVDSARIDRILGSHAFWADTAERSLDHN